MFGKKCELCGGKLNNHDICTECGLDNTKTDKNYHMNESSCDHMPLTHVHKDKREEQTESGWNQKGGKSRKNQTQTSKIIAVITVTLTVAGILINILEDHKSDIVSWTRNTFDLEDAAIGGDNVDYDYNPYAFVERSIPEDGDSAQYTLPCGNYIVGVHIPEGIYTVTPGSNYDAVDIVDPDNSIYIYKYAENKDDIIEDIRLYTGALLTVQCEKAVTIQTDNAQNKDMNGIDNPLTETVHIGKGKSMTAGSEFPAGIYDIKRLEGEGSFIVQVFDRQGQERTTEELGMYEGGNNQEYRYLVLPEGAVITAESDLSVSMEPADIIESENYMDFYEKYR